MKIAIYGTGKSGLHVYKQLKNIDEYEVVGFIDNKRSGEEIEGVAVKKLEELLNDVNKDDLSVFITAGAQKTTRLMLDDCEKQGIKSVYKLFDIAGKNELEILDENNGLRTDRVHKVRFCSEKPTLHYFEVPVTDNCNLNCRGCLFASNVTRGEAHVPYDRLKKDAMKMSSLFEDVPWIRILGGEPLMHPEIKDILAMYRSLFLDSEIDLITNGILIPRMDGDFWKIVKENKITIHVSGYEPTYKLIPKIDEVLKQQKIDYSIMDRSEFWKFYTQRADKNPDDNYEKCPTCGCYEVYRGRISSCSAVIAFEQLNREVGTNYNIVEEMDYIDIDKIDDGTILKNWLGKSHPICAYCDLNNIEKFGWEPSGKKIQLEDYIV